MREFILGVNDFWIVGINFALVVSGVVIGIYFFSKFWQRRKDNDVLLKNMFFAIGMSGFVGGISRVYYVPYYFGSATANRELMEQVSEWRFLLLILLVISAWAYIIHLKPVFYWIEYRRWLVYTVGALTGLIVCGTLAAMTLASFLNPA